MDSAPDYQSATARQASIPELETRVPTLMKPTQWGNIQVAQIPEMWRCQTGDVEMSDESRERPAP